MPTGTRLTAGLEQQRSNASATRSTSALVSGLLEPSTTPAANVAAA
jgi:hypothetical protein